MAIDPESKAVNTMRSRLLCLIILGFSILPLSSCDSDSQFSDKESARHFFERNRANLTPVYGVIKNGVDHVATVHGFVDNLQICKEVIEVLNHEGQRVTKDFSCAKLNDGTLK